MSYEALKSQLRSIGFPLRVAYQNDSCVSFGRPDCHYEVRLNVRGKPPVHIRIDFESASRAVNESNLKRLYEQFPDAYRDSSITAKTRNGTVIFTGDNSLPVSEVAQILMDLYNQTHRIVGL